jgi:hypothetical protein
MKWYKKSKGNWTSGSKYTGRKNNFSFEIVESDKDGYYIMIEDKKTDNTINSLWKKIRFQKLDKSKEFCEKFAKDFSEKRITDEIRTEWLHCFKQGEN